VLKPLGGEQRWLSKMPKKKKVVAKKAAAASSSEGEEENASAVPVPAPKAKDDWLGEAASGEEDGLGSEFDDEIDGDEEGAEEEGGDDNEDEAASGEEGEEESDAELTGEENDGPDDAIGEGESETKLVSHQPGDLAAIKQAIADDVMLLSNWRRSKELGHGRQRDEVFNDLARNCGFFYGYNEDLARYFLQMFSAEEAIKFFDANEKQRPLTIRTNSLKTRRTALIQALSARRASVDPIGDWTKVGLKVYDSQVPIGATPEYLGGQYMIQSASSFVPVMALAPQQNELILDMAAAPGGKTTYIGQLMRNTGTLFANDNRADRCKALTANVHRMGLTNTIVVNMDGKALGKVLPKLDRVLLDAPCSGSGIAARDPSIKVKRGQSDFEEHSKLQKELLTVAVDLIDASSKTGGYVVYSTCSVAIEENENVIDYILKTRSVELVSFESSVNFGVEGFTKFRERRFHPSMNLTRRYYPHVHNMDGFFVAKLKKTSNAIPERNKKDRRKGTDHLQTWGEEQWTEEHMNSVFEPEGGKSSDGGKKKKRNKGKRGGAPTICGQARPTEAREKKKVKRQNGAPEQKAPVLKKKKKQKTIRWKGKDAVEDAPKAVDSAKKTNKKKRPSAGGDEKGPKKVKS